MKFGVIIKGLDEAIELEKKNVKSISKVDNILKEGAKRIKADAKVNASTNPRVRTGFLRRTIGSEKKAKYKYVVYSGAAYGVYLEEGTSKISPKYFIKKAVIKNVDVLNRKIGKLIK